MNQGPVIKPFSLDFGRKIKFEADFKERALFFVLAPARRIKKRKIEKKAVIFFMIMSAYETL
jgi:hypothetical protein